MDRENSHISHFTEYYLNRRGRYYFRTTDKKLKVAFNCPQQNWAKDNGMKYGDKFIMEIKTVDNG